MSDIIRLEIEEIARRVCREEMEAVKAAVEPFVMSPKAADHLHVKPATLRYWVNTRYKGIPFHKAGARVLFKLSELDEWSREQVS